MATPFLPGAASALVLLALAWAAPSYAQSAADTVQGPIPEEVEAYREAARRFHDRMRELNEDTRAYVALRQTQERAAITAGYDAVLEELAATDVARRDAAVARLEGFLTRNPHGAHAYSVRFRLAELYFEVEQDRYLEESEAYYAALESDDLEALEELVQPRLDFSRSIAQYEQIIAENLALPREERWELLDGVYVLLGNSYFQENSAQRDEEKAKEVLRQLIAEVPDSDLVDRAYLFLGGVAFANSQYQDAIAEYEAVVAKGPEASYYYEALYQLAWARFKLNEYDEVLRLFSELLDHSEQLKRDTGRESAVAKDARRFMAFSFADLGLARGRDAHEIAIDWFRGNHRPYEHEIYVELADVLDRYGRSPERLAVFEYLQSGPIVDGQPAWALRPENPEYQGEIVSLLSRDIILMDLVRAGEERLELTTRYGEGSPWWNANKNNPDALALARSHMEDGLLQVAEEFYVRAQEAQDPALYALAAEKYQNYLDTFPIADDWYDQQWYLANAYRFAEDWEGASAEFERMFRARRYHAYDDGALYELMNARLVVTQQRTGPPDRGCDGCRVFANGAWTEPEGPATLPVERTYPSRGDSPVDIPVYALPPDRADFIEAVDVLVDWEWTEVDPRELPANFPDYRAAFEEKRHVFLYLTGQMLFFTNRFDEARSRLERVIAERPSSLEANWAAGLIVDSHLAEGDLLQVRNASKRFSTMVLGAADADPARFQSVLEGSTFELANAMAGEGRHVEAADAFLAFIDEFPESDNVPLALNNAAYYLAQAGKKERANELYEQFVREFPDHEWSRKHYWLIASNYEATFDLDKAIDFYEELYTRFPDDPNAPDALWEASFLQVGLGRHEEAARGFEAYAERYPDRQDQEETFWRAGEQWEKVSDDAALRFYRRYRDKYGVRNPDHAIEAEYRVAQIYERQGNQRAYERQLDAIVSLYEKARADGARINQDGVNAAAAADFRNLQAAFDDYVEEQLTGNDDRDAALLNEQKPAELKAFEAKAKAFTARYPGSFEWISGALYLQGKAALYLADLGLGLQCPKGFSDEECWAYQEVLEEKVFPQYYAVEEVGVKRLVELVEAARAEKRHSRFIDEARAELNRRDPLTHPAVKYELRGTMSPSVPLRQVPRTASGERLDPTAPRPAPELLEEAPPPPVETPTPTEQEQP